MAVRLVTHHACFERIELPEARYEELLFDFAPHIFPEANWYVFKPPIRSPYGTAQPDAALIPLSGRDWWVVEIELARHSTPQHVEPQLAKLRDGWYSAADLESITGRGPPSLPDIGRLNIADPKFMLVIDEVSGPIERVARALDFEVVHVVPFLSGNNLYAASIDGPHILNRRNRGAYLTIHLQNELVAAKFSLTKAGAVLPSLGANEVLVAGRLVKIFPQADRRGFVVALTREEVIAHLGEGPYFSLIVDPQEPLRITPLYLRGEY